MSTLDLLSLGLLWINTVIVGFQIGHQFGFKKAKQMALDVISTVEQTTTTSAVRRVGFSVPASKSKIVCQRR